MVGDADVGLNGEDAVRGVVEGERFVPDLPADEGERGFGGWVLEREGGGEGGEVVMVDCFAEFGGEGEEG